MTELNDFILTPLWCPIKEVTFKMKKKHKYSDKEYAWVLKQFKMYYRKEAKEIKDWNALFEIWCNDRGNWYDDYKTDILLAKIEQKNEAIEYKKNLDEKK